MLLQLEICCLVLYMVTKTLRNHVNIPPKIKGLACRSQSLEPLSLLVFFFVKPLLV
ncbi:hypothetical protein BRARA_A01447 [Brassica rapa]|uniref:Uncharacterized protein n=1 Tax=Brassica campestris TaxID=3711 RepID=A0A398ATH0_BRACM|nr:hypothetical protein BRARA_A01447 [Brassica rapa]